MQQFEFERGEYMITKRVGVDSQATPVTTEQE